MKMNTGKAIILILVIYGIASSAFSDTVGAMAALAFFLYLVFFKKVKGQEKVLDYTKRGGLEVAQVDALYRQYSPIIENYKTPPLSMFMETLHKSEQQVVNDLNSLLLAGRFQQANISEGQFVVEENEEERFVQKEEKQPEIFTIIDGLLPLVKNKEVYGAILSIQEDCHLMLNETFQSEIEESAMNKFNTFYLPKTMEQLVYYKKLLSKSSLSDQQHNAMISVEGAIISISHIFKDYVESVDSAEAFDMEAEAKAIKQMADSDRPHQDFDWRA